MRGEGRGTGRAAEGGRGGGLEAYHYDRYGFEIKDNDLKSAGFTRNSPETAQKLRRSRVAIQRWRQVAPEKPKELQWGQSWRMPCFLDPGSQIQESGPGIWIQDPFSSVLDADPGTWIVDPAQGPGSSSMDAAIPISSCPFAWIPRLGKHLE